jgi:hypothetical protein
MREEPPAQPHYTGPSYGGSPTGPAPKLQAVTAACLLVTVFLPWIRSGFGISISLWDVVCHTSEMGTGWMLLFAVGVAFALFGSFYEARWRPAGMIARWIALGGFATSVGGALVGLVTGEGNPGFDSSSLGIGLTSSLGFGFWLGLGIASVGALISLMQLTAPPNPARIRAPFAASPWGAPPDTFPAAYYPAPGHAALGYGGPAHPEPGHEVPGYLPPAYGPAVYPMPGHMTPAYPMPGHSWAPDWATPPPPPADPASAAGGEAAGGEAAPTGTPTPGHLVVMEAGRSTTLTVAPGQRLLVGRDPDAQIRVSDPQVSARHATIERRGDRWAVQDVDATNPTRLIDAWGMSQTVRGETTISSGQIGVGDVLVTLYPNQV